MCYTHPGTYGHLFTGNIIFKEIINTIVHRDDQLENGGQINNILYIPNENGKIYITTMIIKKMGSSLNKYVHNIP